MKNVIILIALVCVVFFTAQTTFAQQTSSFDSIVTMVKVLAIGDKEHSADTIFKYYLLSDFYVKVRIHPGNHQKDFIIFGKSNHGEDPYYFFYRDGASRMFAVKKEPGIVFGIHKEYPFNDTTERNRLINVIKTKLKAEIM